MKKFLCLFLFLCSCATPNPLKQLRFSPISSGEYTIAVWYKITKPGLPLKVYIEGDGHAFDRKGFPTSDPTPEGLFLRQLAVDDTSPNVVYMARPCQYLMGKNCTQKDWTSGRFSQQIVDSMDKSVGILMKKAKSEKVILVGYSGGALMSALIASNHPEQVQKLITVAPLLNHEEWTSYFGDEPLTDSINLRMDESFKKIPQIHYAGEKDKVMPIFLVEKWTNGENLHVVHKASHHKGFESIYRDIWAER